MADGDLDALVAPEDAPDDEVVDGEPPDAEVPEDEPPDEEFAEGAEPEDASDDAVLDAGVRER